MARDAIQRDAVREAGMAAGHDLDRAHGHARTGGARQALRKVRLDGDGGGHHSAGSYFARTSLNTLRAESAVGKPA